jgi:hypothetical protein
MLWWHWVVLGFVLAVLEILTPGGFFIMFFGVGAFIVGVLSMIGLGGPQWLQWLLFSAFSIVSLLLFRKPLLRHVRATLPAADTVDKLEGAPVVALEDIAAGALGRAELRGSSWSARNGGPSPMARGDRGRVVRVDGLVLWIQREGDA